MLNQGAVEQIGSPVSLYEKPSNRFVAGFLGQPQMNFIDGLIVGLNGDVATIALPAGRRELSRRLVGKVEIGQQVSVGIRPNVLSVVDVAEADLSCRVEVVEHLGAEAIGYVSLEGVKDLLTVALSGKTAIHQGVTLFLRLEPEECYIFGADGTLLFAVITSGKA